MYCIFMDSIDVLCPLVKRLVQTDKPIWVTKEVKDAISIKNELYRHARESREEVHWDAF